MFIFFYMKKDVLFILFITIISIIHVIICHVPKTEIIPDTKIVTCAPTDLEIFQREQNHVEWVRCLLGPLFTRCKKSKKIKISC